MGKLKTLTMLLFVTSITFGQTRDNDPVVIKGSNLSCMIGVQPLLIVAYKFNGTSLVQIPVQIDEVVMKDIKTPYGSVGCLGQSDANVPWDVPFYADANTFTGADTNPLFDSDDEVVFMAKDAGAKLNICPPTPSGVVNNTTCEVELRDPLNNAILGYVYLFQQNGTLNQNAGINYVTYNFTYANNYQTAYDICNGSNNVENSTVTTSNYSMRMTGRWIEDELKISAGGATNVDILDRHQAFVGINNCFRSENTFSDSNGPVVTSKNGPIRAIRSVMGSNSGTFNQITILYTQSRVDWRLDFRVHPIGGYYDVFDMSPAATGMTYYNNQNQSGFIINGVQEPYVNNAPNEWDLYTGNQGTMAVSYAYETDLVVSTLAQPNPIANAFLEAYYNDSIPARHTCTGDGNAYGSSGFHLATGKCTDKRRPETACQTDPKYFVGKRFHYMLPPFATIANAITYRSYALNPITTTNLVALLSSFCSSTSYSVNTASNPTVGGTTTGGGTYASGANVTVTATTNSGYTFVNWTENGNVVSTNASYTFTISANRTLVANFSQNTTNYTVTTSSSPTAGGTTTGGGTYASGANVTVTATTNSGYTFVNWTENGNVVSTNASYTFTISVNRTLVANFSQNTTNYSVTTSANPVAGGTTTCGGTYASGAGVTVTATANSGYTFTNWTESGSQVSTNASYTFTIAANRNLVANFTASPNSATRNNDPVVVKGINLSCMIGVQPSLIVAYKFNGTNLVQIPVQVDEVVVKEASAPYNNLGCAFGTINNSNTYDDIAFYADTNTFTGADTNLLFDSDDELVFMAKDAGSKLNICPPPPSGVVGNTTCELELRDPLNNALLGYVYLFQQNGTLNQSAGISYVNYNFTYANNYQTAYDICAGGMTENSTVTTANYSMKFTKRCIEEELKITAGGATNVDILDRHQFFVAPNTCFRSEDTFSDSRGTVVTSKNGPVRAIRSVMGANSGVGTQWTIKFTESRLDYQMDFRVHPIGGFFDVLDLNPNAVGMMYYNNQNPGGVLINGVQDALITTNPNNWELYTGNQGSIAVSYAYQTDIPLGTSSFVEAYYDDGGTTNPQHICTGDGFAYGASGFHLATGLCTDYWATASGCGAAASYFRLHRRNYILPPSVNTTQAATYADYSNNPITTTSLAALLTSFCTVPNYNVSTSSNPAAGGTTTGSGTYTSGASVTVTATANSGYAFTNWTESGNIVSTNASYTFTISANRNLIANFLCLIPSSPIISGSSDVCPDSTYQYSVPAIEGTTYLWTVQGGTIVSGQGTNAINVLWFNGTVGTISLQQY